MDARKSTLSGSDALALASQADELYVAKGKTVIHYNMRRDKPDSDTLKSLILGPTGNLRAPTLRVGRTLLVGFAEDMYRKVLGP